MNRNDTAVTEMDIKFIIATSDVPTSVRDAFEDEMKIEFIFATADVPKPVLDAFEKYQKDQSVLSEERVTVELCKWAASLGILQSEHFDVAYGWHRLYDIWDHGLNGGYSIDLSTVPDEVLESIEIPF